MINFQQLIEKDVWTQWLKKNGNHSEPLNKESIMIKSSRLVNTTNSMAFNSASFELKLEMRNLNITDLELGLRLIGICIKSLFENFIHTTIVWLHRSMTLRLSQSILNFRSDTVIRMCRSLCQLFVCMGIMGMMLVN